MIDKNYFLGLDIGTNSVGIAVTDMSYKLQKFRGNLTWGVNLFDEAMHADERRIHRTTRRRFERRKQRINLLQDFLAPAILPVDEKFFLRLKESGLLPEDCKNRTYGIYFDDENYKDKDYFNDYPTIHHLIVELMNSDKEHDPRLIYLACAFLLKHRGHFLLDVDVDDLENIGKFDDLYLRLVNWFEQAMEINVPYECTSEEFGNVLKKKIGITAKENEFKKLLFYGKKPVQDKDENYPISLSKMFKFLCGGKVELSALFKKDEYCELERNNISLAGGDFDEVLESLNNQLDKNEFELIAILKNMYDWSLLKDILSDCNTISEAKVKTYEEHRKDLRALKNLVRKYLNNNDYNEIFRDLSVNCNYVAYSGYTKSDKANLKKCYQEDFCKFIKKYLEKIDPQNEDIEIYTDILNKVSINTLCPKQVTSDNRVIPYQLFYHELRKVLNNAKKYIPILNDTDEYGSVADKILSLMQFRIPYYVGPLVKKEGKNSNAWIVRKYDQKIYPWNFKDVVDLDKSENEFIRRMTCKCTYLAGQDVLPKYSLLYSKFCVLNEINNLAINGIRIPVELKQKIYVTFYENSKAKVTKKKIKNYLISEGEMTENDQLTGVDDNLKSTLQSYHDFKRLLKNKILNEADVEAIIERITITTDKKRLKKWLEKEYKQLSQEDVKYVSKLNYKDYGRLSKTFLEGIHNVDKKTGEVIDETIISMLWNTQNNLMQLLSNNYSFVNVIMSMNESYYKANPLTFSEKLEQMYLPTAVRRSVIRTFDMVKEIKHIAGTEPKKIFIEMTRSIETENKKGKRTKSRREVITEFFSQLENTDSDADLNFLSSQLENIDDDKLRSEKYYLYFMQLGKCMYSGEPIDISSIGNDKIYDIDHIYPQSKLKDDSLDNKVLVKSELNGEKSDSYPIKEEIRKKMYGFWKYLRGQNLISEKKFSRLIRTQPFTQEELAGFINRQLVETSQATKAVAELMKEVFPNSDIVYVKAKLVSEFRHEYDMLKCREINDLHHAKDAYLNIVVGNTYDVKFTKNPMNILKNGEKYSMKIKSMLENRIERGGIVAWEPEKSMAVVKEMMNKNSIRYVKYSYKRKGGLFNENPLKKKEGLVERKSGLDTKKYGGYSDTTATYFSIIKYNGKITIIPIELLYAEQYENNVDLAKEYCAKTLSNILSVDVIKEDITLPLNNRVIKINTMIEYNGCRALITKKLNCGKTLGLSLAESLIVDEDTYKYIKKLSSYYTKSEKGTKYKINSYMEITEEDNIKLYDLLCQKCLTKPFQVFPILSKIGEKLENGKDKFEKLEIEKQVNVLLSMVNLLKTGRATGCDLKLIGESGQAGTITMNSTLNKIKELKSLYIIDQSPTGLYEKKSPNLLEL